MLQSVLNFKYKEEYREQDFILSESNKEAFNILKNWHLGWGIAPYPSIISLIGPQGSGKTHLAHLWKRYSGASFLSESSDYAILSNLIIEDIDSTKIVEKDFFHIFNYCHENKRALLVTSTISVGKIGFKLPDLDSRMKSIMEVKIAQPDDYLIKMILFKHFSQRSIKVEENIINYLAKILPRNFNSIANQIDFLDQASLAYQKDITIPFIKKNFNSTL